jgi:hypothetical protein
MFNNISQLKSDSTVEGKVQWLKTHQHFCAKPFHTAQIQAHKDNNFFSSPCCNYTGEIGPVGLHSQFSKLKSDVIGGIKNDNCARCWNTEKINDFSERIRDLLPWDNTHINDFLENGTVSEFNLGVKFSNFCNLACRSCDPFLSSTYAKLKNMEAPLEASTDISDNPAAWTDLLDYTRQLTDTYDVVRIGLIGGETMVQHGAEKYVDYLAGLPRANKIVVTITSNFTSINKKLFCHIDKFRRFDVTASVDSTGDNYHYVRWPAQFSKIQKNIDEYASIRQNTNTLTNFNIASVWGLNNIFYINEYLDFLQETLIKQPDSTINILYLDKPANISIENLPVHYRGVLLPYIQQALQHSVFDLINAKPMQIFLQGVAEFLTTNIVVHDLFDNFLEFTADFDQRTKCGFKQYNSRLYTILSERDKLTYNGYLTS